MSALITHHIFGEDVALHLPQNLLNGEEELLAFLLGSQGVDPLLARFSALPHKTRMCHELAHQIRTTHVLNTLLALRESVEHLPRNDEGVGRAYALGMLASYVLDRSLCPFVHAQQQALVAADPTLEAFAAEVEALIESDLGVWLAHEKRGDSAKPCPTTGSLMRTERVEQVAGTLLSQIALSVFGLSLGTTEYAAALSDYEHLIAAAVKRYPLVDTVVKQAQHISGIAPQLIVIGPRKDTAQATKAVNLEHRAWTDEGTSAVRRESFADLFEQARLSYPAFAEALIKSDTARLAQLIGGLTYEGRPAPTSKIA